jgi:hypothetical protein
MSEDHTEKYLTNEILKSEKALKIYNETKKALQTEERFVNFFKGYDPESVKSFIEYYGSQKAHWIENGPAYAAMHYRKDSRWRNEAVNMLHTIFEKKLFNLKCRWVAGEMDLPGIEISYDFRKWNHNPNLAAGFIEPITEEELTSYLEYRSWAVETHLDEDGDIDILEPYSAINSYHHYKAIAIDDHVYKVCAWWNWYDKRFSTAPLMELPLVRTELQEDYLDIWSVEIHIKQYSEEIQKNFQHLNRQQRKELKADPDKRKAYFEERDRKYAEQEKKIPKYKHVSTYDREQMKMLVSKLETPEVQKYYHAYRRWIDKRSRHDRIDSNIYDLKKIKEWIPVQANDDYRDGLQQAYDDYSDKKTLEALPFVYEEYKECMALKKPFRWNMEETSAPGNDMGDRILAARKWKGEPENFDFLKKENLPTA